MDSVSWDKEWANNNQTQNIQIKIVLFQCSLWWNLRRLSAHSWINSLYSCTSRDRSPRLKLPPKPRPLPNRFYFTSKILIYYPFVYIFHHVSVRIVLMRFLLTLEYYRTLILLFACLQWFCWWDKEWMRNLRKMEHYGCKRKTFFEIIEDFKFNYEETSIGMARLGGCQLAGVIQKGWEDQWRDGAWKRRKILLRRTYFVYFANLRIREKW